MTPEIDKSTDTPFDAALDWRLNRIDRELDNMWKVMNKNRDLTKETNDYIQQIKGASQFMKYMTSVGAVGIVIATLKYIFGG